jgi:hypothetical protein
MASYVSHIEVHDIFEEHRLSLKGLDTMGFDL